MRKIKGNRHVLVKDSPSKNMQEGAEKDEEKYCLHERGKCQQMAPQKSIAAIKRCSNTRVDSLEVGQIWKKIAIFFSQCWGSRLQYVFIFKLAILFSRTPDGMVLDVEVDR